MKPFPLPRFFALAFCGVLLTLPAIGKDKGHGEGEGKGPKSGAAHSDKDPQKQALKKQDPQKQGKPPHEWQKERGWRAGAWQGHGNWKGARAKHWHKERRTWAQRGGYGGYIVPAPVYSQHFGPGHRFRLQSRPVIYQGYPRFAYQGHSFLLVDPYPETWKTTWYESDDVYIVHNDGYYLHNRRHPGYPMAVMVLQ